ncbi:hypothetical protein ABVB69_32530 [Streptomyces sp. NPDC000349]|uniref:hypothetical protein n=1 Tax=unclassified Streptomyces TaxID=2593676 RepID=UPI002786DDAE|nr:hypothetical protein [Streptomyces sp. DSM 40167]MDQ0408820.1 DNA polymerase-3 subunit epsilon [Streptomyces sp. DSM 40167]
MVWRAGCGNDEMCPALPHGVDIVVLVRMMDAEFGSTTFVVVDVEMRRQPGGLVPAAVAALALRGEDFQPLWRVHQEIREEHHSSWKKPRPPRLPHELSEGSAGLALREIERYVTKGPHRIVAALGLIEASLLHNERAACPRLASLTQWDAVELARTACPGVEGGFEELAQHLGVPLHPGRRPATQEAWAVAQVFRHAVERGAAASRWSTLAQLEEIAGTVPKPVEEKYLPPPTVQGSLFD